MSTEIDSRVVEMRFDNQQFERNVDQSLTTLDKLKAALKLDGVSKGIDAVNASAKRLNFNDAVRGIDNVVKKFSTMELIGGVTIANLTNDAVNSAKRLAKALTFDPVKSGLEEYETQINAVQTILANTSHNGTTLDEVNEALDTLNKYADMTIYNFTQMTKNIGTFTAAGIDLQSSVDAIQGIANLAAVSGSTSQQASTAMYQISQALSAGRVALQDWNSIVNAGMGGKVFQDALIRTSEVMGTGAKQAIETYGTFRESLTQGEWLTKEVLTETLAQFAGAYDKATLISQGYSEEQAEAITKMAVTATDAATKVKTFTQLMDTLKEAVQSGWTQTFEILIGDFEEAKAMWTSVSDFFGGIIGKISDARNNVLEAAFGTMFSNLDKPLANFTKGLEQTIAPVEGMVDALGDLDEIANKVINGEFGAGQQRWNKLTELGWNWITVQNKVNEKLGVTLRRDEELAKGYRGVADASDEATEATKKRAEILADSLQSLMNLTNEELRANGFMFDEIKALRDLERVANKTGIPLEELAANLENINGRWLALRAIKNLGQSIINVAVEIKHAWFDVFDFVSDYEKSMHIFDMIAAFNRFADSVKAFTENKEEMDKISRTFKGLFAAIEIVQKILGAGFKIAVEVVSKVLENFGLNILDVTAAIGDAIVAFNNWLDDNEAFEIVIESVATAITIAIDAITSFVNGILQLPQVQYIIENFGSIVEWIATNIGNFFGGLGEEIQGVVDRAKELDSITFGNIITVFKDLFGSVVGYLGEVLFGVKDVSEEIEETGYVIAEVVKKDVAAPFEGATEGVNKLGKSIGDVLKNIASKVKDNVGMGEILTMIFGGGMIYTMVKENGILEAINGFVEAFSGIGESIQNVLDTTADTIGSFQQSIKARQILMIALAISALAASIYLLCTIDNGWAVVGAVGAILVLCGALVAMSVFISKINACDSFQINPTIIITLLGLAAAVGAIVLAFSLIKIDETYFTKWWIISSFIVMLGGFAVLMTKVAGSAAVAVNLSATLISMGVALNLIVLAFKFLDTCKPEQLAANTLSLIGLILAMSVLSLAVGLVKPNISSFMVLTGIAASLLMVVSALQLVTKLPIDAINKAMGPIKTLLGLFIVVMGISRLAGRYAAQGGAAILMVSVAINLLIGAIYACALLDESTVRKSTKTIASILAMFVLLIAVSKLAGEFAAKAGIMLICAGAAMILFSIAGFVLALIDPAGLKQAVAAMSQIMIFMAIIVAACGLAKNVNAGPFIAIASALGILLIALGALSMIEDPKSLWNAVGAISVIMVVLGLLVATTKLAGKSMKSIIALDVAILLLASALIVMEKVMGPNIYKTITNAAALTVLMLTLSGSFWVISKSEEVMFKTVGVLAVMAVIMTALGGILYGMSLLKVENAVSNAVGIGVLMLALSGSFWIISKSENVDIKTIGKLAMMSAVLAIIGLILAMTSAMQVNNAISNAVGIGVLMLALSGSFWIISKSGSAVSLKTVGVVALMAAVLAEIGLILKLLNWLNIDCAIENAVACSVLLVAVGGVCGVLSKLQVNAASAANAAIGIVTFVGILGIALAAIFGLFGLIHPDVMMVMQDGITNLGILFEGLGVAIGKIFTGFGEGLISGLPKMGEDIAGFVNSFATVKPETANSIKLIAEALLALTAAQLLDGISKLLSFLTGDMGIGDFGASLVSLATGMKTFATETDGISWESVEPACKAAKGIMEICNLIPNDGGLLGAIMGNNNPADFGISLNALGVGLADFVLMTKNTEWSSVDATHAAAKKIIDICNLIPNDGGLLGAIMGNNDPAKFGISLEELGKGMASFASYVNGVVWDGVSLAYENMPYIKGICEQIPSDGQSWFDNILNKEDKFTAFGRGMAFLGESMAKYAESVTDIKWENIAQSSIAINDIKTIAESLPTEEENKKKISMQDFGKELVKFGTQLVKFSDKTDDIDVARMSLFAESFKSFSLAMTEVQYFDPKRFENFAQAIKKLGDVSIAELENTFKGSGGKVRDALETVINTITKTINENADAMTIKLSAKVSTAEGDSDLDSAGKSLIASFKSAIDNAISELTAKEVDFSSMGSHYVIELVNGFDSAKNLFVAAARRAGDEAVDAINSDNFFKVGQQCAVGLINGINSKMHSVKMASADMGLEMLNTLKKVLDIHSPSRETYTVGNNFDEGGAEGIKENAYKPVNAAKEMGKELCGVSKEIAEQANKDFKDATSSMTFGTDVLRSYLNTYGKFSEDAKANAKMIGDSKDLLINYAKQLYANSDQFNQDIEKLKECRDKMAELDAEKKQLDAELATADESKLSSLASKQQSLNEQIISCNQELENAMTTISDNIVASFTEIQNSIKETAKAALDFMSIDVSTGVNLLADTEKKTNTVKYKDKDGKIKEKEVEEAIETPVEVMERELNKFKEFRSKIEELGRAGLCDGLLKQLEDLGPEGVEKIDEFLKLTGEEISKANEYYKENLKLSADVFLDNYAETIQVQKDFAENMKKLVGMNFDQGIVEALAKAGAEGSATYMDSFLSMSPAQVKEFNEKYAETLKVPDEVATDIMATLVKAGEQASQGFASGVDSAIEDVLKTYKQVTLYPAEEMQTDLYNTWFKDGIFSAQGFMDGLRSKATAVKNGIFSFFGVNVKDPAAESLDEHSPSKVFKKYGQYVVEGFVIGVNEYAYKARASVTDMASGVKDNAIKTLSGIDDAMVRKAEYSMRVKPVVNMDDRFKKMSSSLNVTPIVNDAQIKPISQTNTILKHVESSIAKNNAAMSDQMHKLSEQMINAMNEAYMNREVSLYVDGRKMASTLAQPMSREFKVLSNRGL